MVTKKCLCLFVLLMATCLFLSPGYAQTLGTIQSFNKQNFYFTYHNEVGIIYPARTRASKELGTFIIRQGLANPAREYISFESAAWPGYFLRHQYQQLKLHKKSDDQLFLEDATFKLTPGLASQEEKWFSFEALNYPGYFIRHKNSRLLLEENDGSKIFKLDATFRFIPPLWDGINKTVRTRSPVKNIPENREATTLLMLVIIGVIYIGLNLAARIKQKRARYAAYVKNKEAVDEPDYHHSLTRLTDMQLPFHPPVEENAPAHRKTD